LFFWDFLSQFVISDTPTNRDAHSFISAPVFDSPASPPLRQPKQSGEEKEQLPFAPRNIGASGGLWDHKGTHYLIFDVDGTRDQLMSASAILCDPLPKALAD